MEDSLHVEFNETSQKDAQRGEKKSGILSMHSVHLKQLKSV